MRLAEVEKGRRVQRYCLADMLMKRSTFSAIFTTLRTMPTHIATTIAQNLGPLFIADSEFALWQL